MTNLSSQTNGASLEDCHSNLYSLTDVCGIKWVVLRSPENTSNVAEPLEDPVLSSFARCLDGGLLSVWRRVPRRYLVDYAFDNAGNQIKTPKSGHDDKNQLSQCKELWVFWYGEKPDQLKQLVHASLKEMTDVSGSWETGIPYEARTLLFKALNNLIERSLLSKQFVRIGKWFVQPFDGTEKAKSSHLSFSFSYFIHGESAVCASVDVREHAPVRRLTHQHISAAGSLSSTVQVVLAPYGMAATLTGVTYKEGDPKLRPLLEEWKAFWPLTSNGYMSQTPSGTMEPMPEAVEVVVSGVRLIYPVSYVLVTDLDVDQGGTCDRGDPMYAYTGSLVDANLEPGPYTVSNHPLLSTFNKASGLPSRAWSDAVLPHHELAQAEAETSAASESKDSSAPASASQAFLKNWDFVNPCKAVPQKHKSKSFSRERFKELRAKYHSKNPFHRKAEVADDLGWTLDQEGICGASSAGRLPVSQIGVQANRVPSEGLPLQSPMSVGPVTPRTAPSSVKVEGGGGLMPLLSPHPPLSNGPTTPFDMNHPKTPGTPGNPLTPGNPRSQQPVPSPYHRPLSASFPERKPDPELKPDPEFPAVHGSDTKPSVQPPLNQRPALPVKEYEVEPETERLTNAYDYKLLNAWLSHPVKRYKGQDTKQPNPKRPMYRRRSQSQIFTQIELSAQPPTPELKIKPDPDRKPVSQVLTNGDASALGRIVVKTEVDEKKDNKEDDNLFSADGLKPSIHDLDNMFEDSDNELNLDAHSAVPTPPSSVKDVDSTKMYKPKDPPASLAADQLHQMFPTPPSHEPADQEHDQHYSCLQVKMEPRSPLPPSSHCSDLEEERDISRLLASSQFAPLSTLYSDNLPSLHLPSYAVWKHRTNKLQEYCSVSGGGVAGSYHTPQGTPASLGHGKPGLSPISPAPSVECPKSNAGPGSVGPPSVGAPRSVGPPSLASPAPHTAISKSVATPLTSLAPSANSLTVNLVLSDSLLNLYRDINFNSCTMCVCCTNDGNIRGGESLLYLPDINSDEDYDCKCGYSAVMNRKLSYMAGMFLEDEREVTGIQEDVYFKKKPSLLLLDPKSQEHGEQVFNERAEIVDEIPAFLLELVQRQISLFPSEQNTLMKFCRQFTLGVGAQPHQISVVEALDGAEVIWSALETVREDASTESRELDTTSKASCLHQWSIRPTPGPYCSEDIVRVMKALLPLLNDSLHTGRGSKETQLAVTGPLTWRQFHRMAGVTTKGNTDDGCEPLPIPTLTVGFEREWISLSPLALAHWDSLSLEPWGPQRNIAYIVVSPDNENILSNVKCFFKNLNNTYANLKLGKHVPLTKALRDGILRVGSKLSSKLETQPDVEEWFQCIGDSQSADILRLYSKVCHHYLVPYLSSLSHDASLLRSPASSETEGDGAENKENTQENLIEDESIEPPAIVIYMVDPVSYVNESTELVRLSTIALLRCFNNMVPNISVESIRQSLYLQTVSLDSVFSLGAEVRRTPLELNPLKSSPRASHLLKGLAFSVYAQSHRTLSYHRNTKTLTGFGPASTGERFLQGLDLKDTILKNLYTPPYVLAPPPVKNKKTADGDSFGSSTERSTVLFVHYCLSDDQKHLLASLSDDRGELVRTTVININIPNRTRRKKASARRVGLSRLWDWILSVVSLNLVPWRLVIGRLGRIGHGELRGWSVLLSRNSLKKAVKQLKDECPWRSDFPSLLSVCLVSMEPDGVLRVMSDQFTPDERFGSSAAQCALSTPRDATATHILVFPTSATAQSSQAAFNDHQEASVNDDLGFGFVMTDIDEMNPTGNDDGLGLGDLNDIFNDEPFTSGVGNSPGQAREGEGTSLAPLGSHLLPGQDPAFRYGQEEPGERLEILQQPLALGYLTSTAPTGQMPRWFWASAPHLENVCPVFLKSSLHINISNLAHGGDDGFTPQAASARVHSLDSNYTTDVLRYVLEGYNALSWLAMDPQTRDRQSCLPLHVQALLNLYHAMSAIV